MNINKMKNVVVLKNLPSNIIDEAIVILKQNNKAVFFEDKKKNCFNEKEAVFEEKSFNSQDFIVKEAEMVIQDFVIRDRQIKNNVKKMQEKYLKLRRLSFFMFFIFCLVLIIAFKIK